MGKKAEANKAIFIIQPREGCLPQRHKVTKDDDDRDDEFHRRVRRVPQRLNPHRFFLATEFTEYTETKPGRALTKRGISS